MKKIFAVLAVLSLGAASIFAQPKLKSASAGTEYRLTYELNGGVQNMVTIIPAGNKVELDDFAGKTGTVVVNAYEISKYEVTQGLYKSVMGTNPSNFEGSERPVENVTWYDAVKFCNELTKRTMGESECCYTINGYNVTCDFSKKGFRLPTEVEWEMAARGGLEGGWDNKYSGTNSDYELSGYAWYSSNSGNKTHEVGTKMPNAAGLYDMSGNVYEWCWDLYIEGDSNRVNRGGSWCDFANYSCVAYRYRNFPGYRYDCLGFRVCRGL